MTRTSDQSSARVPGAVFFPLVTLALFLLAVAVMLAVTPLWELPDTYCQTAVHPPSGDGCAEVTSRRRHWIAVVVLIAVGVGFVAVLARRHHRGPGPSAGVAILLVCAVGTALAGAAFLLVGRNHEMCGSTLSRVDPDGSYAPDRPALCAPSYAASREDAWISGGLAAAVFVAATALVVRPSSVSRRRTD